MNLETHSHYITSHLNDWLRSWMTQQWQGMMKNCIKSQLTYMWISPTPDAVVLLIVYNLTFLPLLFLETKRWKEMTTRNSERQTRGNNRERGITVKSSEVPTELARTNEALRFVYPARARNRVPFVYASIYCTMCHSCVCVHVITHIHTQLSIKW